LNYDRLFRLSGGPHRVTIQIVCFPMRMRNRCVPVVRRMRCAASVAALLLTAGAAAPIAAQERPGVPVPAPTSPFWGGVPTGTPTAQPIPLSLYEALKMALAHNLGVLAAEDAVDRANGARWVALSDLLPNVRGTVSETERKTNLEAFGFPLQPPFPRIVGPFDVFDARVFLRQQVFDLRAINAAKAESHRLSAARFSYRSARDLIVLVAANLYLEAVAAGARVDAARAQLDTARALHNQALDMKTAGTVAGIEVLRAEVRVSTEQLRTTAATNVYEKAKLQLARMIGLPLRQEFTLAQTLPEIPLPQFTLEEVVAQAYERRPDYLAAAERLKAAEADVRAAKSGFLPSVEVTGDYGVIGLTVKQALPTFSVTGQVNVPLFEGGRTHGRTAQARADLAQRRSELEDLRASIYYNTRSAFLDLQAAEAQLQTAMRARELAALQLTQARDRFAAGVASNLEVVQAQEAVAAAAEGYISALYDLNIAKALVLGSPGSLEEAVEKYLGGNR
jgi:outer membrane protein TolC